MIVASGYLELDNPSVLESVSSELKARHIEISETTEDRIVFLIERESSKEAQQEVDSLKDIPGTRSVYLAYFSLDGADQTTN